MQGLRNPCHFFILGSMKGGTTTLHDDLSGHPDIFLPTLKEPGYYVGPAFGGPTHLPKRAATRTDYERLFTAAGPGQKRGESSTYYSQVPKHAGVPQRILAECGPGTRFIYLMREPAKRAISHYKHDVQRGYCTAPTLAEAIDTYPDLIDFSRYETQIRAYLEVFAPENILLVRSEAYFANRAEVVAKVLAFLDLDPAKAPQIDADKRMNTAEDKRSYGSLAKRIRTSATYHRYIKPLLPRAAIKAATATLSRAAPSVELGQETAPLEAQLRDKIGTAGYDLYSEVETMAQASALPRFQPAAVT